MRKSIGFHNRRTPLFSPSFLFMEGAPGVWYDPSDLSTLFQDSSGTTPVSAVEQVVGRMLDKSGRGNHITATGAARPTLSARVNILNATAVLSTQSVTTIAATYTLYFTGTGSITLSGTASGTYSAGTSTITCTAGVLTLTVSGTVTTADLRTANVGVNLPIYQRVTSSTDYDTNAFPLYLAFSGAQAMATPANVNLTGTNSILLCFGIRKLSDSAVGMLAELSASAFLNNGTFAMAAPGGALNSFFFRSNGTAISDVEATFAAPTTRVVSAISRISTDTNILRVNGTQAATSSADQGTGNYGSYQLNIGARNSGASLFLNGRLYGLIVLGAAASSWQVYVTEQWMAGKTGLQF